MKVFNPLRTETFILRELKTSDKKELFPLLNRPEVYKYIPGIYLTTLDDIEHIFILANLNRNIFCIIEDINSQKIIGIIFASIVSNENAKVSYLISECMRGKGIMPKALKLFIRYLYIKKIVKTVYFYINVTNTSSVKVIQKLNIPIQYSENDDCLISYLSLEKELPF